jgi:hypothetical protein
MWTRIALALLRSGTCVRVRLAKRTPRACLARVFHCVPIASWELLARACCRTGTFVHAHPAILTSWVLRAWTRAPEEAREAFVLSVSRDRAQVLARARACACARGPCLSACACDPIRPLTYQTRVRILRVVRVHRVRLSVLGAVRARARAQYPRRSTCARDPRWWPRSCQTRVRFFGARSVRRVVRAYRVNLTIFVAGRDPRRVWRDAHEAVRRSLCVEYLERVVQCHLGMSVEMVVARPRAA